MNQTLELPPNSQRGFVLVTSLIFLVIITLIAVSAINSSTLQERMASNLREKSRTREAADATLRHGEQLLERSAFDDYQPPGSCYPKTSDEQCGSDAVYILSRDRMFDVKPSNEETTFLEPAIWRKTGVQKFTADTSMPDVTFFIEEVTDQFQARDLNPDTAARGEGGAIYRITARARGQNLATTAVTRSLYEKRY